MMTADVLTVADLAGGDADRSLFADSGALESPFLVVELDPETDEAVLARAAERARAGSRLLIGFLPGGLGPAPTPGLRALVQALDATIGPAAPETAEAELADATAARAVVPAEDPEAALAELCAGILANPQTALIFGQALRASEGLTVPAALDVESLAYSTLLGGTEFRRWLEARGPRPAPPPAPQEAVLLRREADRLAVTLNRPERRNAYGAQVRDALVAALGVALADPSIREVLLDGAGPSFCAGGDLDEFGSAQDLAAAHLIRTRGGAARLVHELAGRMQVRLHGHCVGAGIEIPALAGRVIADPGTLFRLPEVGMGLVPGAGGTTSLPRRIGRWRAFHLCVTGMTLDARTALRWGLIDEIQDRP